MHADFLATIKVHIRGAILGSAMIASLVPAGAHAATTVPTGQALEIGPPVINLTADPGQKITASLSLRDVSTGSLLVTNEINDFTANGEDGTPKVVLDGEDSPYSLKTWISPIPSLSLKSRDVKTVPVTINVPASASPGGYYGIVRFTGTPPNLDGSGVSLNASLGALVFIRVNGAAKESIDIAEFSANKGAKSESFFETVPINFVARLQNTGNIYEQPTGLVTIKDMFGHTTATLPINADQHIILSASTRQFSVPLDSSVIGTRMLFGHYTAHLDVTYGTAGTKISKEFGFWVIPYKLVLAGLAIIIAVGVGLFFLIRRYNRMIVKRASRRK